MFFLDQISTELNYWGGEGEDVETNLFSNDNVQIVFSLVDMRAHWDNTAHTGRIGLGWPDGWGVHN